MKKIKLLVPTAALSALAAIAMPLTSCGSKGGDSAIIPIINIDHGSATYSTIKLNNSFTVTIKLTSGYELSTVTITIGSKTLKQDTDYKINGNVITVQASAVTSSSIVITITSSEIETTTKVITTDTTLTSGDFKTARSDKNAVLVNGKNITANLSNLTLNKTGNCSKTEDSSFYGTNSALLAKGGSKVVLDNINVTTNASGANGVFAYGGTSSTKEGEIGDGTNISISNSTINTSLDNSGGIMVAGHASLTATDCTVTTQGDSSAAIRSDRGGDTMNITGGTYTSNGLGSPAIYATAAITVEDAGLISTKSQGIIVEGSNNVVLKDCTLEDTNCQHHKGSKSTEFSNIFLYQSTSGDAGTGKDSFSATNCTIKTHQGDDFYVTNQTSTINLTNNAITNDWVETEEVKPYFLRCKADHWGTSGKNGGHATLNANKQTIGSAEKPANIDIDSISTLKLVLNDGSKWTGALTNANQSTDGVEITIDDGSGYTTAATWTLTADSYIGKLGNSTTLSQINVNGHKLYAWDNSTSQWKVIKG